MRYLAFCLTVMINLNLCAQTSPNPENEPAWIEIENWDFTTMTMTDLLADWNISPYLQQNTWAPIGGQTYGSSEPSFAYPSNVTIGPEGLVLHIKKETNTDLANTSKPPGEIMPDGLPNLRTENYTQAVVRTYDPIQYGYIQGRIKCSYGYNFHSGFWSHVENYGPVDPLHGVELDFFEMVPTNTSPGYPNNKNIMKTNYHMKDPPTHSNLDCVIGDYMVFRDYGVLWTPKTIAWYVDGILVREIVNPGIVDPFLLFLNFSLNPIPYGSNVNESLTPIPSKMVIEFVKVHQLEMDCNTVINDCGFSFFGYDQKVKKSITIGACGTALNVQPIGSSIFLRATDFIEINGAFTVPLGSKMTADIADCY